MCQQVYQHQLVQVYQAVFLHQPLQVSVLQQRQFTRLIQVPAQVRQHPLR